MLKLDRCYKIVQQSSAKGGIKADEIAEKMDVHRTTVYGYLKSLQFKEKVYSDQGLWKVTTEEQTIMPLEKEIVIELPLPKNQLQGIIGLELLAKQTKDSGYPKTAKMYETIIETFNETRRIKIKGKNIDDLDLEKVANLIQQANKKNSKVNVKGLLKKLKP